MDRRLALGVALLVGAQHAAPLQAQREGVLKQVDLPHAYYWREMYVPQATSGPSSATWSPDGTELIYSMQGTLWRQHIGSDTAVQLTSGPVYDYQPDWSPDGRTVVFARYARDAIELDLLDLASGNVTPLTANHAVNLEPRWSPDGSRIVFVSSIYNGRWHIFIIAVPDVGAQHAAPLRITDDNDSKLSRYYYSKWDHYISPTWSPDGKEIILVSNRGHIHGTGGFWRMAAQPGAAMRELRYEETTWKARPDWSPDGTRVIYSSYLGRQWNQLWLMPSEGGDPLPLTYGEFDATAPRWSRDGKQIAYVSNEGGKDDIYVVPFPNTRGGKWPVSTDGGTEPVWSHRGTELFYRDASGNLVAVGVNANRTFSVGRSRVLFPAAGYASLRFTPQYAVARDDRRFLMVRSLETNTPDKLIVVENWFEELKAKSSSR